MLAIVLHIIIIRIVFILNAGAHPASHPVDIGDRVAALLRVGKRKEHEFDHTL
jgi:hypothetical protein